MKFLSQLFLFCLLGIGCMAQPADSLEIIGQFTGNISTLPAKLRLTQYKLPRPLGFDLPVSIYGSFSYKTLLAEPTLLTLSLPNASYNFIAGPGEKIYRMDITMQGEDVVKVNIENSEENNAYNMFTKMVDPFLQQLFGYLKTPANHSSMVNNTNMHLANMRHIVQTYKNTYTANVLAGSLLFDSVVTEVSPGYFKDRLLKANALNSPAFYNTTHSADILSIYTVCLLDTPAANANAFYNALFTTVTDSLARSRLHELLFQLYFYKQREIELGLYADWANSHPQTVTNAYVKRQLNLLGKVMPGKKAPELSDKDIAGNRVSLTATALAGKKTVLAIWSPNCDHCREEIPQLSKLYDKYRATGLQVYSVAIDCAGEDWKQFSAKNNLNWVNTYHPTPPNNDPLNDYMISYTPTYVVIDSAGNIISRFAHFEHLEGLIK